MSMVLGQDPVAAAMMTHRVYQAATMSAALAEVKRELGRDAVILRTRSFRRGGFFGLIGGKPMWEVVASAGAHVRSRLRGKYVSDRPPVGGADAPAEPPRTPQADGDDAPELHVAEPHRSSAGAAPDAPAPRGQADSLAAQMAQLRQMVESLLTTRSADASAHVPVELRALHDRLLAQEVAPDIATAVVGRLRNTLTGAELSDPATLRQSLLETLSERIRVAGGIGPAVDGRARVVALIGPTGVGKTTTIAKLAANLRLKEHKRVGLITIDTYRIAAVDQLQTYADIIEVPLRAVLTPAELAKAVQEMHEMDVVLIDTVGRSQNDKLRLGELRGFLAAADADEVHLVVAATSNRRCGRNVLSQFGPLGANRIILTKLDEAETYGMILNLSADGAAAVSYVTAGQDVPDDIEQADARRLAQRITGEPYAR